MDGNKHKATLLGIPYGTANNKLKKSLLFDMAKRLGEDTCFRCQVKITNIDEFSIEHKISWMFSPDPIGYFYDLDNIAFSHIICNVGAATSRKIYASDYEKGKARTAREYGDPVRYKKHLEDKKLYYHRKK